MHTRLKTIVASVALCSALAWADPPKPRVMVIMDTSKSMTEKPKFVVPSDAVCSPWPGACVKSLPNDAITLSTPGSRGDYDPVLNNGCDNKFCAAKSVVYNVLPDFADDARIGITTYFQYILTGTRPESRATRCSYDILAPAGQSRIFSSLLDYTGGGAGDLCSFITPFGGCAKTASHYFPDSTSGSGSNLLKGLCKNPPGYTTPTDPLSTPTACSGSNLDCYQLVKRHATPQVAVQCSINAYPAGGLTFPRTLTASTSWCTAGKYTSSSAQVIAPALGSYYERVVASGTLMCPGAVVAQGVLPAGLGTDFNSLTSGTAVGNWLAAPNTTVGMNCSAESPCTMFLGSSVPVVYTSKRNWFLFYGTSPVGASPFTDVPGTYGAPNTYTYASSTAVTGYTSALLTGTRSGIALGTTCLAYPAAPAFSTGAGSTGSVGRYTTGSLSSFGINAAKTALASGALAPAPGSTDQTPGLSGTTYNCRSGAAGIAGAPCDVTVTNDVTNVSAWVNNGTVYTPGANTATTNYCNASASPGACKTGAVGVNATSFVLRATNPSVSSCPVIGTVTSNPAPANTTWSTAPVGCGVGAATCQFSAPSPGIALAGGSCPAKSLYTTASPGVCVWNGKPYDSPTTTAGTMSYSVVGNSTACPNQSGGTLAALGSYSGTGCGAFPCDIAYTGSTPAADEVSTAQVFNPAAPPAGWSGVHSSQADYVGPLAPGPTTANAVGVPDAAYDDCLGPANSVVPASGAVCPGGGSCLVRVLGMQVVSTTCTAETANCYSCRYQPLKLFWSRPRTTCTYATTKRTYTVDQTTLQCTYTRPQWKYETKPPDTHTCTYSVGVRRADFVQETQRTCQYWNVKSTLDSPRWLYTYEYQTKGTELLGRGALSTPVGSSLCTTAYGGAFQTACPEVNPNCVGVTPSGTNWGGGIPANSTCKLRWGGGNGGADLATMQSNRVDGRYFAFNGAAMPLPGSWNSPSCEAVESNALGNPAGSVALPASAESYKSESVTPVGFCTDTGQPALTDYRLISDWYDPSIANTIAPYTAAHIPGATAFAWNNTPRKTQGFGGGQGPAVVGPGTIPPRSLFVPIPNDALYNSVTQRAAIQKISDPCVMPRSATPPNADGSLAGGACIADMVDPQSGFAPGVGDVTPLYGSLKTTYDHLVDRYQNDENAPECRGYYIILATDGAESTPAGYTVEGSSAATSVEGLVASFRNFSGSGTRPDVKTFVIGFGEGASASSGLNAVAAAGGTNAAFAASSQSELATALRTVFTTITQGTFSRSKPTLGTDGSRLYTAQYIKPSVGPDWSGLLTAYRISSTGNPVPVWELSNKLDQQPSRTIKVALRKKSDSTLVVGNFTSGNAELVDQIDDCTTCAVPYDPLMIPSDVISFLSEEGHPYFSTTVDRSTAAGPIVTSSPVVVGKSPFDNSYGGTNAAAKAEFAAFGTSTLARGTRVLFQSNDGQAHSVYDNSTDAACTSLGEADMSCPNGTEAWALVPGMLSGATTGTFGQPMLAQSLYALYAGGWNQALLDGTLSLADVCENAGDATNCLSTDWRTIAIGTQRAGGRGLYALDVTHGSAPGASEFLWDYSDGALGLTYSVPSVGRVQRAGKEEFVAIFGGGLDDPNTLGVEGNHIFVLNALHGTLVKRYDLFRRGAASWAVFSDPVLGRPSLWRKPGHAFLDSAFLGVGRALFTMRFANPTGTQWNDATKWEPDEFFDPASSRNSQLATNLSTSTTVNAVVEVTPGTALVPPTYDLAAVGPLPIDGTGPWVGVTPPPIFNRPKMASVVVASGNVPDLFVGTGDVRDPQAPAVDFQNGNFFYAVHDFNAQPHGAHNDGRALWVVRFPGKEQVVSEPAILSGCVVVATYTPPVIGATCGVEGDTTLYGFDPVLGTLVKCLYYQAAAGSSGGPLPDGGSSDGGGVPIGWEGQATSVVKLKGVGIPSDLVVVNDNLYLQTSRGGLQRAPARQAPQRGTVRSFRRVK